MFKNEYQGGAAVEIFGANGKDLLGKVKHPVVKRIYEKDVKGYVYVLEGSTTTARLQIPFKEVKLSLGLIQRFLLMQVYVPLSKDFAVELTMCDIGNCKRRVVLSSSVRDVSSTPLHAKLPLSIMKRDIWLNLCFDLISLISDIFPSQTFKSLESFIISGNCKVKKVFTLKSQPFNTCTSNSDSQTFINQQSENIPHSLQFSSSVPFHTQVLSVPMIRKHQGMKVPRSDTRETSGYWSSSSDDLSSSRRMSARDQLPTHIAFGTKVSFDTSKSRRIKSGSTSSRLDRIGNSSSSSDMQTNRGSERKVRSSKARLSTHPDVKENSDPSVKVPVLTQRRTKQTVKSFKKIPSLNVNEHLAKLPTSIVNLVDNMESPNSSKDKLQFNSDSEKAIFDKHVDQLNSDHHEFLSQNTFPRPETESAASTGRQNKVEKLQELSSISCYVDREHGHLQHTHAPIARGSKSISLNPISKISHDFSDAKPKFHLKNIMKPQSSLSPDISRMQSPPQQLYDSSKYTDASHARQQSVNSHKPPLNKATMSLKSSDSTLTASVDTLVHSSICKSKDNDKINVQATMSDLARLRLPVTQSFNNSHSSVVLSRKSVRELPRSSVVRSSNLPESSGFQVGDWSESFEADMLASLKRGIDEEMKDQENERNESTDGVEYHAQFDDSFDASWSMLKNPPPMHPHAYDSEIRRNDPALVTNSSMNRLSLLARSNPRDWANLLSPPIVMPSVRARQKKESLSDIESIGNEFDIMGLSDGSSSASIKSSTTNADTDEEMLDLLYDPCLNCYFDPKSGKYYELKN